MKDWLESDLARYENKQVWVDEHSPVCDICGEEICGDSLWVIEDTIYCEDCLKEFCDDHKVDVVDYIEETEYELQMREYEYAQDAKGDW